VRARRRHGLTSIALSLRFRVPVLTAWSTPGAAMLITSAAGVSMPEAIGAFLVSAALITISGFSGLFERMISRIPISIASGMLAGVLLRFGLDAFLAMQSQFVLVFPMFCAYLLGRRLLPRYAIIVTLLARCRHRRQSGLAARRRDPPRTGDAGIHRARSCRGRR
jgi:benzoate membrane transport protein